MGVTQHALQAKGRVAQVYFEQGRGRTGVPKAWVHDPGTLSDGKHVEIETLVALAVSAMRAICADPNVGHGQDLMPEETAKRRYVLHNLEGAQLDTYDGIQWHRREDGWEVTNLVLCWGLPSEQLAALRKRGRRSSK